MAAARRKARPPKDNVVQFPQAAAMPFAFVVCHSMGHQWRHVGTLGIDDEGDFRRPFGASTGMVGYRSECVGCTSERIAWVTRSGEKINRYAYAEGYSRRGEEAISRAEYRQTFAASLFDEFTPS
jgi:hypothetical protein